jgi:hypothetical protein
MPLLVVTNERDASGRLIEQLIVSQQEEDFIRDIARKVVREELSTEYRNMGLPYKIEEDQTERGKVFGTLTSLYKFKRWIIVAGGGLCVIALTALAQAVVNHSIIVQIKPL